MSLLDLTYFTTPDCNIPQGSYNTIQAHLDRYERDILIHLLGYDLAKLVLAYDSGTSPQRIKDIVEGKEYTEGDYTVKWNGLLNDEKVSILAYYTFMQYVDNNQVTFNNGGVNVSSVEGGDVIFAGGLIQQAGFRLRELAGYCGNNIYLPSLYNFLMKHSDDYPEWIFNEFKPANLFDI